MAKANIPKLDSSFAVIGETTIAEAKANGWPRMVSRIFVCDTAGKILIQQRSAQVAFNPHFYDFAAAGHVDVGETFASAARRELSEEVGITVPALELIVEHQHTYTNDDTILSNTYKAVVPEGTPVTVDPEEVQAIWWLSAKELDELVANKPDQLMQGLLTGWRDHRDKLLA